jgi:hypothetical protein
MWSGCWRFWLVVPVSDGLREALAHLVALKDGPRDLRYYQTRDAAWRAAREALAAHPESDGGAAAPGGSSTPVAAGPTSEATSTAAPPSPVCPYCGMSTWVDGACALPGCEGHARPVLSLDAVAEVLRREVSGWPLDAGLPFLPDREWDEVLAEAIVALARSEQEVREQIADAIEAAKPASERSDEPGSWKRGERHARMRAARIARGER